MFRWGDIRQIKCKRGGSDVKVLYFDCFSGISGDMTLGALLDLGLDRQVFLKELEKLGIAGEYEIKIEKGIKRGVTGLNVTVEVSHSRGKGHDMQEHHHPHDHEPCKEKAGHGVTQVGDHEGIHHAHGLQDGHHHEGHSGQHTHAHDGPGAQRNFRQIKELIESSALSLSVKDISLRIFEKLAIAEGKIHGIPSEQVHFHEVGAVDSIVDIVGTAICIDMLKPDLILVSPVNVGGGFVKCQHGIFPVPAPATLELLKGVPIYSQNARGELVTPTGAAILSALCHRFVEFPSMVVEKIGYGLGKRDYEMPNCLRVCWGDALKIESPGEEVRVIETNIDDMSGELVGFLMERLFEHNALDVWYTPIYMKKNRPGVMVSVLCHPQDQPKLEDILLKESTTLGVRSYSTVRRALNRRSIKVSTRYGDIRIKVAYGEGAFKASPEYEDCRLASLSYGVPIKEVYEEAMREFSKLDIKL